MGHAESQVEGYLVAQAERRGFFVAKLGACGKNGMPDRLVVAPSGTVFVETKAPGGRPSPIQRKVHSWIRRAGGEVHVIHTRELVDVLLDDLDSRPAMKERKPYHGERTY